MRLAHEACRINWKNAAKNASEAFGHIAGMGVFSYGAIKASELIIRAGQPIKPEFSSSIVIFTAGIAGLAYGLILYLNTSNWRPVYHRQNNQPAQK